MSWPFTSRLNFSSRLHASIFNSTQVPDRYSVYTPKDGLVPSTKSKAGTRTRLIGKYGPVTQEHLVLAVKLMGCNAGAYLSNELLVWQCRK
jgi:hypothetical protein